LLLLLCSTATFKKTNFQTYFNQVSLGYRDSGVNTLAQTRQEEEKTKKKKPGGEEGGIAYNRNLKIYIVKKNDQIKSGIYFSLIIHGSINKWAFYKSTLSKKTILRLLSGFFIKI
jgi:hypothetical protein